MNTDTDPTERPPVPFAQLPWLHGPLERLEAGLAQDRLPHAILLSGPEGIGKRVLAEHLVDGLLCLEPGITPCGVCRSCALSSGAHPDRFVLEPAEDKRNIAVDQVRALINNLVLTSTISPRRAAMIYTADALNANSANALLKTLEEPPGQLVLVLVSHDPSQLLPTIRSRCQLLPVPTPPAALATDWLRARAELSPELAQRALEAASGSPLRALELVDRELLAHFITLRDALAGLIGKPSRVSAVASPLQALDPAIAWRWLSIAAAGALRGLLTDPAGSWPQTDYTLPADKIARLQRKAEWGMGQLGKGLRQDLLLQEWLLEWSRLPAPEPIR